MLVDQFERIHEKKQESLLLISHQERIIRMADRILVVNDGRIEDEGTREEMLPKLFPEDCGCACRNENGKREDGSCECEAGCGGR